MKKEKEIEIPFMVHDFELGGFVYTIPEGFEAKIEEGKIIVWKKESEDERIRKWLVDYFGSIKETVWIHREFTCDQILSWLEKQKEQKPCDGNCGKCPCYNAGLEIGMDKEKPAEGAALQKAFISSKIDYTLEEKRDAADYADVILPTNFAYGENEEEYKLHKIIEAAFIAGQKKEQKSAEWSEEDEKYSAFIVAALEAYNRLRKNNNNSYGQEELNKAIDWIHHRFKSLRPQHHWKPTEEQMEALDNARFCKSYDRSELDLLYDDLKKL